MINYMKLEYGGCKRTEELTFDPNHESTYDMNDSLREISSGISLSNVGGAALLGSCERSFVDHFKME